MRGLVAKPGRRHIAGDDRRRTHRDPIRRTGGAGEAPVESDHHVGSRTGGDRTGVPTGKARGWQHGFWPDNQLREILGPVLSGREKPVPVNMGQ